MDFVQTNESGGNMSVLKLKTMKIKTKKLFLVSAAILLSALAFYPNYVRAEGIMLTEPLPGQTGALTKVSGLADYLVKIYNLGLILAGVLAMGGIMIGGFLYMTASYSGNLGKTANGKDVISSSLLGLGVALLSYLLIYTIDPRLTRPQDVFMDIGKGTCSGGIPNVEDAKTCKGYCTVGNGEEKYQVFTPQYDTDKCCKCLPETPSCSGSNKYDGIGNQQSCEVTCKNKCPSGKKCAVMSYFEGCCECSVLSQGMSDVNLECGAGQKMDNEACNEHCSKSENCAEPLKGCDPQWTTSSQCCICTVKE